MSAAYEVLSLDDLDRIPVDEGLEWRPIRRRLGIRSFGTNGYTSERVGGWVVEEHVEGSGHEELYVVVSGRARFTLDGEELDAPAGTIVFLPENDVTRKAVAEEEGTTVLAFGGWPDRSSHRSGSGTSRRPSTSRSARSRSCGRGSPSWASVGGSSTSSPATRREPGAETTRGST